MNYELLRNSVTSEEVEIHKWISKRPPEEYLFIFWSSSRRPFTEVIQKSRLKEKIQSYVERGFEPVVQHGDGSKVE